MAENIKHTSGYFKGQGNLNLYYQSYLPPESPSAVLLILHGLAEHSGRYMNVVDYFVPKGYAIYSFDQRGHGRSEGARGYIENFSHYLADVKTFFEMVRQKQPDGRFFLMGHSVGGMIAVAYSIHHQNEFDGLVLSGATIKPGDSISPMKIALARLLSLLMPKLGVEFIDASAISQDQKVVKSYVNDPLVYHGKIKARLGAELIRTMQALPSQMPEIQLPILIISGTADRLSNPEGSRMLFEGISSQDKTLKFYEGFYHEVFNEPGRKQVLSDVGNWLNIHPW